MWAQLGKAILTYVLLPLIKWTIGAVWKWWERKQEEKKIKMEQEAAAQKLKEAKGEQAIDAFNHMP